MISSTVVASSHRVRNLNPRCLHFSPRTAHLQAAPAHPLMVKPALQFYTNSGRKTSSSCSYTNTPAQQRGMLSASQPLSLPRLHPTPRTHSECNLCLPEWTNDTRVRESTLHGGEGHLQETGTWWSVCVPQETAIHKHTALLQREHFQS